MEVKYLVIIILVVILYLCVGAAIFMHLEKPAEMALRKQIRQTIEEFKGNHTCVDQATLDKFFKVIMQDVDYSGRILEGKLGVISNWDFPASFCFVVTTVTTIGYGNFSPSTAIGKIVVVVYALIGIPLTLIMLGHIGDKLKDLAHRINKLNLFSKKPHVNKAANMFIILILGISVLFIAPSCIFHAVEDWSILEAIYYCFVTLSTIGFGDYVVGISGDSNIDEAATNVYRIATYTWIIIGLAYISLIVNYISSLIERKGEQVQKQVKKLETELEKKHSKPEPVISPQDRVAMEENGGVALVKFFLTRDHRVSPMPQT